MGKAAEFLSKTKGISLAAAKKRIATGRINVKSPAKAGESKVKTKAYKTWSRIVHGAMNPNSKDFIRGMELYEKWKDFDCFYRDVGDPPDQNMAFTRIDQSKGFLPDNCAWLTKSETSKINAKYMKSGGRLTGRRPKLPKNLFQRTAKSHGR